MPIIIPMPKEKKPSPSRHKKRVKKKQAVVKDQGDQDLIASIKLTQGLLKEAYSCFHQTSDPDLLESYVYEINALKARHNYLSKQLRDP